MKIPASLTRRLFVLFFAVTTLAPVHGRAVDNPVEQRFRRQHDGYVSRYRPLAIASARAWWNASLSGRDADFEQRKSLGNAIVDLQSDKQVFAELKQLRESGQLRNPELRRLLEVMYFAYLPNQADPELSKQIVGLEADVEQTFNTHRSEVDGDRLTENEVRQILKDTSDTEAARKAWAGYMRVGTQIDRTLRELVKLRNQVAQKLGYRDYFAMRIEAQEFDEKELFELFDELDALTRKPFAKLKEDIDARAMTRFGIARQELRPWHTSDLFFQEAPDLGAIQMDDLVAGKDPVALARTYYDSIGLDVGAILERSDLYEKEGKSPHAFCISIDRKDDVRILCNVKPNFNWLETTQHELGHAVYDQYIGRDLPFLLHEPAHILTTEGIAMFFDTLTKTEEYLTRVLGVPADQAPAVAAAAHRQQVAAKLIFSRWTQVMLRFEQGLYANPEQDLNALWWRLKKKYQLLNAPEHSTGADYGAKIHIVVAPVYYHNYMLGDLFASQVCFAVAAHTSGNPTPGKTSFFGDKQAGQFLRKTIFEPGNRTDWRELIRQATGEDLTAKYYARLYVE